MMKSPYESGPYVKGPMGQQPPARLREIDYAGKGELALFAILTVCSLLTVNGLFYGGARLCFAVGMFGILAASGIYVLCRAGRSNWYPIVLWVSSLLLTACIARTNDGFLHFLLFCGAMAVYLLALSQAALPGRWHAGRIDSLSGACAALIPAAYGHLGAAIRGILYRDGENGPQRRRFGAVVLGLLLAIPALLVIVPLLARSDEAFASLLYQTFGKSLMELVTTVLFGAALLLPVYTRPVALSREDRERPASERRYWFPATSLNAFLLALSFFYVLYLVSQLAYFFSAFSGILPPGYTAAQYARRGFTEMTLLCVINLAIVSLSLTKVRRQEKIPALTKVLSLFILVFSLVLVCSACSKMGLYIQFYGLTRLRVLTSLFMLCTAVSLICTGIWAFAPRFGYMRVIVLSCIVVFGTAGLLDVDTVVARYNVSAYLSGQLEEVDVSYLDSLSAGALPQMARLVDAPDAPVRNEAMERLEAAAMERFRVEDGKLVEENPLTFRNWTYTEYLARQCLSDPELFQ